MRVLPRRVLVRSAVVAGAACAMAVPAYAASTASAPTALVSASRSSSAALAASSAPAAATTARSSCGKSFTLKAKTHTSTKSHPLIDVRAGKHTCYDRLVLEFRGAVNGYTIRYVKHVTQDGSGKIVPLAGKAALQVTVVAPAYDEDGNPTYNAPDPAHLVDVTGFTSFRQVAWAGSFEGYTTIGVGMRRGLPFRVLVLNGPGKHTRIAIDVAHNR